jgi:hypothetical protein
MKTIRTALLHTAIGLALVTVFAGAADAREQDRGDRKHQVQHEQKPAKAKARQAAKVQPRTAPAQAVRRGDERRAQASGYRAPSGRQDARFAPSRPDPHAVDVRAREARERASRQAAARQADMRETAARRASARQQAARDAAARQAVLRDQAERHWQREASRRNDDRRPVRPMHPTRTVQPARNTVERQRLIALQRQRAAEYQQYVAERQRAERQRIAALQEQRRLQQYRYQQWYWQQQQAMRERWNSRAYDYNNDPYYYTPASYRYVRAGRAYEVNRYAADLLQQAVRYGYEMGVRAGNADRMDGWRSDWRGNPAYRDASYGYNGYYVDQDEYNYYFRQGFQRGYQDAYGNDYRYGTYYGERNDGNIAVILASVLQAILGLQPY